MFEGMTKQQLAMLLNSQVIHITTLRGIVTLLAAGEKVTEDAVWEVVAPLGNPNASRETSRKFKAQVQGLVSDILTSGELRTSKK